MAKIQRFQAVLFVLTLSLTAPVLGHAEEKAPVAKRFFSGTETKARATVIAFHKALQSGDIGTARGLLDDDVLIFESGSIERSADEYAAHHMLADMKYFKSVNVETIEHHVEQSDDLAISISRSTATGSYEGKNVDSEGNETITLRLRDGIWKIAHIHWSNY